MGADYLFYVNFIAIRVPTFFGHIISVLASVRYDNPIQIGVLADYAQPDFQAFLYP